MRSDLAAARRGGAQGPGRRRVGPVAALAGILVLLLVALAAVVVTGRFDEALDRAPDGDDPAAIDAYDDEQPSLVIVTHDASDPSGPATGIQVLAHDRASGEGTVLLVPTATIADVPGYGSFPLREAFALGGAPLVEVSLANLLGVRFDGHATLSQDAWGEVFEEVGGFALTVRSRLVAETDAGTQARFEPGTFRFGGPRLAEYLTFRGPTETELETLPRVQDVVLGLLERIAEEPGVLDDVFRDGQPPFKVTDPQLARVLFEELAHARADGQVTTVTMPVSTLGTGREDSYRVDTARLGRLVEERLSASRPTGGAGVGRGVQILNGNGVPGVGQQVAELLADGGYRIVLTGNADAFDYDTTRIIVYDASDEQLAVATDVRDRLGVGEIQRSATTQSVVDITIVVGNDFPG